MSTYIVVERDGTEKRLNALKFARFAGECSVPASDANGRLILNTPLYYWKSDGKWHFTIEPFIPARPMIE